ncbi:MAG: transglycosylase domain-containing protein [Archangium sp.]|nr:transglycosylase domain-containing protein [Archangium sp.]MDP3570745.1 transglycosylase domain-containing protein [Archangium sp.]
MNTLRVLLATLVAVPLLAYSAASLTIAFVLRDVALPVAPKKAPSLAHRGLACVTGSSARVVARHYRGSGRFLEGIPVELALNVWLVHHFDDDQLIRLQGDRAWFGRQAYGLEAGARAWFGRSLEDLSIAQASLLVGMENSPHRFDPTLYPATAWRRRQLVLGKWQACGLVPPGTAIALEQSAVLSGVVRE